MISFAASDAPTPEQLSAVINSFEETAFAGLEPDQYDILWVKHTHTGSDRVELHFVTPRVELTSGKSLNIAPPGSNKYFEPWRDYWNTFQNWASPNDPQRGISQQTSNDPRFQRRIYTDSRNNSVSRTHEVHLTSASCPLP